MRGKVIKIIIIILLIVCLGIIVSILGIKLNEKDIIDVGYEKFGSDFCTGHSTTLAGDALSEFHCLLCGEEKVHSNTDIPKICVECSKKTGRCQECGKLLKKEEE